MSESQFPRSLFPQFTEGELEKASKSFKSSVNWTEYNKWVEAGKPFQEHDEIIMNQKLENGYPQKRLAGTGQQVDGRRKYGNGISTNRNSGKTTRNARKTSNGITSTKRAQTTACKEGGYCGENSGPNKISNVNKVHESDALRSTKGQDS